MRFSKWGLHLRLAGSVTMIVAAFLPMRTLMVLDLLALVFMLIGLQLGVIGAEERIATLEKEAGR